MPTGPSPEQLSKVLRLCTALAYRALDAKIMRQPAPAGQDVSLAKVANLLRDHGVELPPLLAQVLHEVAGEAGEMKPEPTVDPPEGVDLQGLTGFFAGLRMKDQP
ncbi:hypothetical protein [Methylobacterium sp. J-070]|uniref:hypothetical protein n=1 Tax=Methylobacterium sp. J-070 TaxID=2836650 RepID=UPI001FB86297|nr:hypothetical protein [Methylobacterium sp. J-070]MCJ2052596.1 hypothetical protein [Methylobacterium sp. J-070]